ncbi:MAG: adenosylhomocysteinase [Clostridia bacterium]|nr:adenosylhomocysteinase [Clostridia bacterium]MBQ4447703.1 adenosylhomocysteinase [Clostridia bacterium]MBR3487169.1 adenosylhomocysteinase [Clostridia bacterium]
MSCSIRDISLAPMGHKRIEWVKSYMPVLNELGERFRREKPFKGLRVSVCVHLEAKTAYLCLLLRDGGAEVAVTGSNPLSTKDDICAALAEEGVNVYAWFGSTPEEYHEHIRQALEFKPHIAIDDGGEFVSMLHDEHPEYAENLIGGCEETTTGILKLKARVKNGALRFPMMAVNDANCKHLFDNRHGTGQSTWDAIMYTTNNMVTGKTVVVAGYGFCASGIAMRAKGLGANVIVTEVNPYRALEAAMDGFRVMKMDDAAPLGDVFVTATGCCDVITARHFEKMKDGVILANSGHFDVEVSRAELERIAVKKINRKPFIDGYVMEDGRTLNLMAEGRLVNITAGNGHPAEIMDLSFAIQALSAEYLLKHGRELAAGLYNVPEEIDREVAMIKIRAMGLGLDELTPKQQAYLAAE